MAEIAPTPSAKTAKKRVQKRRKAGPSVGELIVNVVAGSQGRSGVSLHVVKKALVGEGYDVEKNNSRVKNSIKALVEKGTLIQRKGVGARGSFKINKKAKNKPKKAKNKPKKAKDKPKKGKDKPKRAPGQKVGDPSLSKLIVGVVAGSQGQSGVSLSALKKALVGEDYDVEEKNHRIKKTIKALVVKGTLIQMKGMGANGSFKVNKKAEDKSKKAEDKPKKAEDKPKKAEDKSKKAEDKPKKAEDKPKKAKDKPKKAIKKRAPKQKMGDPSLSELIVDVVAGSQGRSGVSLHVVKKALVGEGYDVEKNNFRIKKTIKALVVKGTLIQMKGMGASGSFRVNKKAKDKPKKAKAEDKPKKAKEKLKKAKAEDKPKKAKDKPKKAMAEDKPKKAEDKLKKAIKKRAPKQKMGNASLSELIVDVVAGSQRQSGISLYVVKKALVGEGYDVEKNNFRVKNTIKALVEKGTLIQTKGFGASGSFKMNKKADDKQKKAVKKTAPKAEKTVANNNS